jgi:hypothetical protein
VLPPLLLLDLDLGPEKGRIYVAKCCDRTRECETLVMDPHNIHTYMVRGLYPVGQIE